MRPVWIAVPLSIAVLMALGDALVTLASRRLRIFWYERWAVAWLFGAGAGAFVWFLLQPLYHWVPPVFVLTAVAAMSRIAVRRFRAAPAGGAIERPAVDLVAAVLAGILCAQFAILIAAALWTTLGWDGLFNFELKARLAFEHVPSGQLPVAFFGDPTRVWSHPRYPPLVPFSEYWVYGWIGGIDQASVKILFPMFYISLAALVCGAVRRMANLRWALATAIALGCVPALTVLPGAASGYADVPLAASTCGAACFAFAALRTGDTRYSSIAAGLLAVAVWTKAEGVILAGATGTAALAAANASDRRRMSALLWAPAAALVPWYAALALYGASATTDFRALTPRELVNGIGALSVVWPIVVRELFRPGHWGLIWPGFLAAVAMMIAGRRSTPADWFLAAAVIVPLNVYTAVYLFSAWADVAEHAGFSFPRLLVPLAPVAMLFVARRVADDWPIETVEWA